MILRCKNFKGWLQWKKYDGKLYFYNKSEYFLNLDKISALTAKD